jgi:hypothetical protein
MPRRHYVVSLNLQQYVSAPEIHEYILDALDGWSGQFHPDHPLHRQQTGEKETQVFTATPSALRRLADKIEAEQQARKKG